MSRVPLFLLHQIKTSWRWRSLDFKYTTNIDVVYEFQDMHLRYIQRSLPVKDTLKCLQTNHENITRPFKFRVLKWNFEPSVKFNLWDHRQRSPTALQNFHSQHRESIVGTFLCSVFLNAPDALVSFFWPSYGVMVWLFFVLCSGGHY